MNEFVRRGVLATAAAGLLVATSLGCGADAIKFSAPAQAMLQGGVNVSFQRAEADDETLTVKLFITNLSTGLLTVNRNGIQLRLPNGQLINAHDDQGEPYFIQPQQGHSVWVDFKPKDMDPRKIKSASVLIGGISYIGDPTPRVVGEVPLTAAGPKEED